MPARDRPIRIVVPLVFGGKRRSSPDQNGIACCSPEVADTNASGGEVSRLMGRGRTGPPGLGNPGDGRSCGSGCRTRGLFAHQGTDRDELVAWRLFWAEA